MSETRAREVVRCRRSGFGPAAFSLLVCTAAAGWAPAAIATELWSRGGARLDFSGSVREIFTSSKGTNADDFYTASAANPVPCTTPAGFADCPAFDVVGEARAIASVTRLRTRLDLRATEAWSATLAYDLEFDAGHLDTFEAELGEGLRPDSLFRAEGDLTRGDRVAVRQELYRGYLMFESEKIELVLGRQRVPWGVGRLWNPIDRFNAIGPLAVEADQSPGVDALLGRWLFSGFSFVELVAAPLRELEDGSYALRAHGVISNVDASAVVGYFERAVTAGIDFAGNVGDAAARLEVVYAHPTRDVWPLDAAAPSRLGDFWQVVGSVDYLFDLGSGLYVLLEHLYNGNALGFGAGRAGGLLPFFEQSTQCAAPLPTPCVRQASNAISGGSRVVTRSAQITGMQLGYDITPELRGDFLTLYDWSGVSASFVPSLSYSPLDWLEVRAGAQLFAGGAESEFGNAGALVYLLAEAFF